MMPARAARSGTRGRPGGRWRRLGAGGSSGATRSHRSSGTRSTRMPDTLPIKTAVCKSGGSTHFRVIGKGRSLLVPLLRPEPGLADDAVTDTGGAHRHAEAVDLLVPAAVKPQAEVVVLEVPEDVGLDGGDRPADERDAVEEHLGAGTPEGGDRAEERPAALHPPRVVRADTGGLEPLLEQPLLGRVALVLPEGPCRVGA